MTVLSYQSVKKLCIEQNMISPCSEKQIFKGMSFGLSQAGYDVRIAQTVIIYPNDIFTVLYNIFHKRKRQSFMLASTIESFNIPSNVLFKVADKSSWARKGIAVQNTVGEPGWIGQSLTLEITNHSYEKILIEEGMAIAQVIFYWLDAPTEKIYLGKYQNQSKGPVAAIYET